MTEKRFTVKGLCIQENSNKRIKYYLSQQGSVDSLCMRINQLFDECKKVEKENQRLKKELEREETDKKRLMSFLIKYKGYLFDEIVEDILDEPYYDNWWEDGFYEYCWNEYLKEKGFDGCDEE